MVEGPWTIPIIKRHERDHAVLASWFPLLHWNGRSHSDRKDVRVLHNPSGYESETPIGWVVTSGFYFLDRPVFSLVKPDGNVVEISREWYEHIDRHLDELEQLS